MENLKQEALNILMLAKEIQHETGASFENAKWAIEQADATLKSESNSALSTKIFDFGTQEYQKAVAKQEEQRAKWEAQEESRRAEYEAKAAAEPAADELDNSEIVGAKIPKAKAQ
jgi:hypothetical protein